MNILSRVESEFGPPSYYLDSDRQAPVYPQYHGNASCDVCVVGGGFAGVSTALNLAEAGYKVVLMEAGRIGWGASGRNGGQLINGYAPGMTRLARMLGEAQARRMWELSLEATQMVRDRIDRHTIAAEYKAGYLLAAARPRHMAGLRAEQAYLAALGYTRPRILERAELESHVKSRRYYGGLIDMGAGHLHPLKYVRGLAAAAAAAGVRIFEKSRVTRVDAAAVSGPSVDTAAGQVRARHVALCCNAYLGELEPYIRSRIMPVGTYMIATEPLGRERALALLPQNACVSDTNFVLDYFRLSADWRVLFGGRVSYTTVPPLGLANRMRRRLLAVFPELQDVAISHAWGGFVDISLNRLPDIGRRPGNIYYAQGFSGQGVALTGLAGKLIADAIRGDAEKFDVFARIAHRPFPGGRMLRMPLLMLATLYGRLQDLI